jgi:hypothetical protein
MTKSRLLLFPKLENGFGRFSVFPEQHLRACHL